MIARLNSILGVQGSKSFLYSSFHLPPLNNNNCTLIFSVFVFNCQGNTKIHFKNYFHTERQSYISAISKTNHPTLNHKKVKLWRPSKNISSYLALKRKMWKWPRWPWGFWPLEFTTLDKTSTFPIINLLNWKRIFTKCLQKKWLAVKKWRNIERSDKRNDYMKIRLENEAN